MKYTEEEVQQIVNLCRELLEANETLNSQLIALMAKLGNEEKKVKRLLGELYMLQQQNKNYTA